MRGNRSFSSLSMVIIVLHGGKEQVKEAPRQLLHFKATNGWGSTSSFHSFIDRLQCLLEAEPMVD